MQKRYRIILLHVLGCLVFLSLPVIFSPDIGLAFDLVYVKPFLRSFTGTALLLIFFYFNYYFLIPKYYLPKKYVWFFLLILVCYLVVIFVPELLMIGHRHHIPMDGRHLGGRPPRRPLMFLLNHNLIQFLTVLVFSIMLKLRERLKQIETEKANAELSYLKAQINPHFLFNTLNSIYSLAIQKHDKTADAVVKLSDMMRYVLNDGNTSFVLLDKELHYISNYIDLQKMRLSSIVKLSYHCKGEATDKKVAPLILIPFIENAFKHGVSSEEESDIKIEITISEIQLHLMVKNYCVKINNNTLNKSGLGIENTKKRLELLYPHNHLLKIDKIDNYFIVNLTLNIHD